MNYLIQVFACSPSQGGEYAVSWGWISHLCNKISKPDHIYVLSLTLKQEDLVEYSIDDKVTIIPVDGMEKWSFLNYNVLYQMIWQRRAYSSAMTLGIKFDFVHVYSLSDFRRPGRWYKLKDAVTVFGPVGGGQVCPAGLHEYESKGGRLRELINKFYKVNPFYKKRIFGFTKIYACNLETKQFIPQSELLIDVPLRDDFQYLKVDKCEANKGTYPIKVMFAGRLIQKKGVSVLIDSLAYIDEELNYELLIYGEGYEEKMLRDRVNKLGLERKVRFMGKVPYEKMMNAYMDADIFVMPSLRESGGSVLVEAMAHKLPIVALDMSMAHFLCENGCGLFVNPNQSKEDILRDYARCITELSTNNEKRALCGENGYRFVNEELSWNTMVNRVYGL